MVDAVMPPRTRTVHPMAFEFPRRAPAALFFPTVHIHDGEVHETAMFDHRLYCQLGAAPAKGWESSNGPASSSHRSWCGRRFRHVVRGERTSFTRSQTRGQVHVEDAFGQRLVAGLAQGGKRTREAPMGAARVLACDPANG